MERGKKALVTGITGQDGAYLSTLLLEKGYQVFGTYRRLSTPNFWRLQYLNILDRVTLIPADLIDAASVTEALKISEPDEVYNLAAQSFVGASFEQPIVTAEVTGLGVARILEAIRSVDPGIRLYQASTSELYGNSEECTQSLRTAFQPASPYAAAKLYGHWMTRNYRDAYGLFACNGILFNHESPLRGLEFVTRKISNAVARISLGLDEKLALGNVEAFRDWGFAPEYVEAMWRILQQPDPDDFVIATNEAHSVREFAERAFRCVGLDYEDFVETDRALLRPTDVNLLCGDYAKAEQKLGWTPETTFESLVKIMVEEDVSRWQRWQKGEHFPWDAPQYAGEPSIATRVLRA